MKFVKLADNDVDGDDKICFGLFDILSLFTLERRLLTTTLSREFAWAIEVGTVRFRRFCYCHFCAFITQLFHV